MDCRLTHWAWIGHENGLIEVDGVQDLLVWVDPLGHGSVVADQLKGWHALESGEDACIGHQLDDVVKLGCVDVLADVGQVREDDGGCATLLHLENVAEHLTEMLVIENDKDN